MIDEGQGSKKKTIYTGMYRTAGPEPFGPGLYGYGSEQRASMASNK